MIELPKVKQRVHSLDLLEETREQNSLYRPFNKWRLPYHPNYLASLDVENDENVHYE